MGMPHPLKHLDHFGEANLDTTTLRHLREAAIAANAEDERIRAQMSDEHARTEWDPVFARDSVERHMAIARIDAELARRARGPADLDTPDEAAQLLRWLAKRTDLELTYSWDLEERTIPKHLLKPGPIPEHGWTVHKRSGSVNDREWTMVSLEESPLEALRRAHKAFCD